MREFYYINDKGEQVGPLNAEVLKQLCLSPQTYVWTEGLNDWIFISELPEFAFSKSEQPPRKPIEATCTESPDSDGSDYANRQASYNHQMDNAKRIDRGACPPTYMALSIIMTIICCLPCGIAAIIHASKVSQLWMLGDYEAAKKSSENAKLWIIIGLIIGLIPYILYVIVFYIFIAYSGDRLFGW